MTTTTHRPHSELSKIPGCVAPDLPCLLQVNRSEVTFGSSATSKVFLQPGALFTRMTSATYVPNRTYTSVQAGRDAIIELNSDLAFVNHSCDPSVEFDMTRFEVRVVKHRPLCEGDELSFFYPSTEWRMVQPFDCQCAAPEEVCLKRIEGAAKLDVAVLKRYWLNKHIEELLEERIKEETASGSTG